MHKCAWAYVHVYVCTVSLSACLYVCIYGYVCVFTCALTEVSADTAGHLT